MSFDLERLSNSPRCPALRFDRDHIFRILHILLSYKTCYVKIHYRCACLLNYDAVAVSQDAYYIVVGKTTMIVGYLEWFRVRTRAAQWTSWTSWTRLSDVKPSRGQSPFVTWFLNRRAVTFSCRGLVDAKPVCAPVSGRTWQMSPLGHRTGCPPSKLRSRFLRITPRPKTKKKKRVNFAVNYDLHKFPVGRGGKPRRRDSSVCRTVNQ